MAPGGSGAAGTESRGEVVGDGKLRRPEASQWMPRAIPSSGGGSREATTVLVSKPFGGWSVVPRGTEGGWSGAQWGRCFTWNNQSRTDPELLPPVPRGTSRTDGAPNLEKTVPRETCRISAGLA